MNIFKRNQVVITALVIMIAIAGYLNFTQKNIPQGDQLLTTNSQETGAIVPNSESEIESTDNKEQSVKTSTEVTAKESNIIATAKNDTNNSEVGEAVFTNNAINISDYFIQVKLNREQLHAKEKESLMQIIDSTNLTQEQKGDAAKEIVNLQKRIEKETASEDMLKAKGFKEVYVRFKEDGTVDVLIGGKDLSDTQRAQIQDVIKSQIGVKAGSIVITPVNMNSN